MREVDVHFPCGWDFLDDYKLLLGALVVPLKDMVAGEDIVLCARFASDPHTYKWPASVERVGVRTVNGENGVLVRFSATMSPLIEEIAWAYAQGERKRSEARIEPPFALELIVEHAEQGDSQRVVARDISQSGCKIEAEGLAFAKDEPVVLSWAHGRATGRVRWADGSIYGIRFDVPLSDIPGMLSADVS